MRVTPCRDSKVIFNPAQKYITAVAEIRNLTRRQKKLQFLLACVPVSLLLQLEPTNKVSLPAAQRSGDMPRAVDNGVGAAGSSRIS